MKSTVPPGAEIPYTRGRNKIITFFVERAKMRKRKYIRRAFVCFMLPLFGAGHGIGPLILFQIPIFLGHIFDSSTSTILVSLFLLLGQGLLIGGLLVEKESTSNLFGKTGVNLLCITLVMIAVLIENKIWLLTSLSSMPFLYYSTGLLSIGIAETDKL